MSNWTSVPLSSLIATGRSISYGIVQPGAPTTDGVPIVRVANIRDGRIAIDTPLRVSAEIEAAHARTRLKGGELLLTLVGTVGETAVAPLGLEGWNVARAVAVVPVREDVGSYWVKLAIDSPAVRERINARLNTTVQATLNLADVAQLPILLPSKSERGSIIDVIGSLDDKIELNRHMSQTLEAIAQAIFKSWFVDFEPVRAKAAGARDDDMQTRFGVPMDLASALPSRLRETEVGSVPLEWPLGALGDVAQQVQARRQCRIPGA